MSDKQVGIISAGAWGTAIAKVIAGKDIAVDIWDHIPEVVADITDNHKNEKYLPGIMLPEKIRATASIQEAADGKDFLIIATPSIYMLPVIRQLIQVPDIQEGKTLVGILTKGFINIGAGPVLISQAVENYLPGFYRNNLVYISGPSHAEEVAAGKLTGLISASKNGKNSIRFRELLSTGSLLVFSSFDIIGVQTCAALKNVIAVAFGILDALSEITDYLGDNTESLLLAAGLNEIQKIGQALGATHPETFTSIAGVGDLDVTCRSKYGRNRRFGRDIINHKILDKFSGIKNLLDNISEVGYLPEGAAACMLVHNLCESMNIKAPISEFVFRVLNRELDPLAGVTEVIASITRGNIVE
ncbi:MAG: NAD(P)-dependent glycerol-3-phosphate dehydrogenase [Spirochaetales bacterium]|nr:NAD(P)-dependent glycerol-3-phosphate dehydrogenase [Spirochaetales bacterium]